MLNYFYKIILSFLLFTLIGSTYNTVAAQDIKGTEFWFTLSNATPLTPGQGLGNFVFIVSDFCIDSGAYIEIPGLNFKQTFTVARGQYTEIAIPININGSTSYPDVVKRIQKKGIHIVTPKPVTVYLATVDAASSDGETILPVNYLGNEYVSSIRSNVAQDGIYNIIVGTEDSTDVTFKSWNGGGNPFTETVRINRGETYYWYQGRTTMCNSEYPRGLVDNKCSTFDNSVVKSTKPIALMGTAKCSWGWDCGACEVLINMPLPTSKWSNAYATVQAMARARPNQIGGGTFCARSTEISGDFIEVMGKVGTKVLISHKGGKDIPYTIPVPAWDNGANYGYGNIIIEVPGSTAAMGGDYGYANTEINSDNPIQVTQYPKGWQTDNVGSADPEAIMISPINMWKSSYLFAILFKVGATTANNIAVITADPNPQIELNGNLLAGWINIPNTNYRYLVEPTLLNVQTNRIINRNNIPFGVTMVSSAQANSFVTTGGSGDILDVSQCPDCPIAEFTTDDRFYCDGEEVTITDLSKDDDPSGATKIVEWVWDYGDGSPQDTFTTSMNPTHTYPGPGNYTITLNVTNNGTDPGPCTQTYTLSIKIGPGITVDAGQDFTGCEGDTYALGGSPTALGGVNPLTFNWTNGGDLDDNTVPNPTLTLNGDKTYKVTVTDSIGCKVDDEVEITSIPKDSVFLSLVGTPLICTGESYNFRVNATPGNGSPYDITLTDGTQTYNFTNVAANSEITVNPSGTSNFNITSVSGNIPNSCISYSIEKLNVEVKPIPTVKIISAQSPICEGNDAVVRLNLTGTGPWNIGYTYNGVSDEVRNIVTNAAGVTITPASSGTFTITSLEYSNNPKCSIPIDLSKDIIVNTKKDPGTNNVIDLCVTDAPNDLTPLLGPGIDAGTWIDQSNSSALSSNGTFDPAQSGEGEFIAQYFVTGNAPCPDTSAFVTVTVHGTPVASDIVDTCNSDLQGYVVRFNLSGGDPDSYTSPDGNITGNGAVRQFLSSQTYANKTTYNISVTDQYNCGSLELSNYINCGCKSKSGSMNAAFIESCETDSIQLTSATGSVLLPVDTLLYVLHEGSSNTIVAPIVEQAGTNFGFDPNTMVLGRKYYVSAVVGPALNNSVDYSSDCISISQGQPVAWYKKVSATANLLSPDVCVGDNAGIRLSFSGNGPFTARIKGTNLPETEFNNLNAIDTVFIAITQNDSIFVDYIADKYCASNERLAAYNITARQSPTLKSIGSPICNGTLTQYTIVFDVINADTASIQFIALEGTGTFDNGTGRFTSDPMNSGDSYNFQFFDQFSCDTLNVTGAFTCACISDGGKITAANYEACRDQTITMLYTDTVGDANDVVNFALHPNPTYVESEVLKFFPTTTINFLPGMTDETQYYVTALVGSDTDGDGLVDLTDDCLDFSDNTVPVLFYELPHGTFDNPAYDKVCLGQSALLPLTVAGKAPFVVEALDSEGNSFTKNLASSGDDFDFIPTDTLFIDVVKITDANGCISSVKDRANVDVLNAPVITISTPTPDICEGESLDIDIKLSGEGPFNFDLIDDLGNTFNFTNINAVAVVQNVTPNTTRDYYVDNISDNTCTGIKSNTLTVTVNTLPAGIISGNANICDGDNLTLAVNITGGQGPYELNLDGTNGTRTETVSANDNLSFNYSVGNNRYNIVQITDGSPLQCVGKGNFVDVEVYDLPEGNLSGNYQVCENDSIAIAYDLTGEANFTFDIIDDLGNVFGPFNSSTTTGSVFITFDHTGDRTLQIRTIADNHCPNPTPTGTLANITVLDIPVIDVIADNYEGCVPLAVNITNNTDLTGVKSCTWTLDGELVEGANCNGFSQVFTKQTDLDLNLILEFESGCVRSKNHPSFIKAHPLPLPSFNYNPNKPTIVNSIVNFENTSVGSTNAYWTIDVLKKDTGNYITYIFPDDSIGIYKVDLTAVSQFGCVDSTSKLIKIDGVILFYMPSAFTPNGDGINEGYGPVVEGTDQYINSYTFSVFNRWGQLIFNSNTIGEKWDGTYLGQEVKPDAYTYKVSIRSSFDAKRIEHIGTFVVLR